MQGSRFAPSRSPIEPGRRGFGPDFDVNAVRREDRGRVPWEDAPIGSRRAGRSPPRDLDVDRSRRPPTGPGERKSRFDSLASPADTMDVDVPPPRVPPPAPRSTVGGMHADRMLAEPPRGPRAMAPRDGPGGSYPPLPSSHSAPQLAPINPRQPNAPLIDTSVSVPGRGRGRPMDRRWETNESERRPSFSGPASRETSALPLRRVDEGSGILRDLPDRPAGRPAGGHRDERPPRISGTNNVPIGTRPSGYVSDTSASNAVRSPVDSYRRADDYGDLPRRPPPVEPEPYDRRRPPFAPPDLPLPGPPRGDRGDRRPSLSQDGPLSLLSTDP
ncbi:hypothetical protein C8Q77DRAFT_649012 [Trametes polyzona]|nr:hypothetical protein C8Q77DRAFT_649012 [Trametes polyzona]